MSLTTRLELFRLRREARIARWEAKPHQRRLLDELCAEVWPVVDGDVELAKIKTRMRLEGMVADGRVSLDPATIIALVQIAIMIYKLLKAAGLFSPTPEVLVAMLDEDDSDE